MKSDSEILEILKMILFNRFNVFEQKISFDTKLSDDLWLDEESVLWFIADVEYYFQVDFSHFEVHQYEFDIHIPIFPLKNFFHRILSKETYQPRPYSLTLQDVINSIKSGKWVHPCNS
ncbi:MAG: DUF1493 family protein [Cytophagales bacterium]|nr:MAG: DUF1493 family protein [Cytophagales bacterium]TAF61333.1 MAG: DUF1493 family protein [Cytophagales bacterium]